MVERVTGWLSSVNARVYPRQIYNHCNIWPLTEHVEQWHSGDKTYALVSKVYMYALVSIKAEEVISREVSGDF